MWLYTVWGMVSVVCSRKGENETSIDSETLLLRFRLQDHVTNFQERFPELQACQLMACPHSDYPLQLRVPKHIFATIATELAEEIDWPSFRQRAEQYIDETGSVYLKCLRRVWRVTRRMQGEAWD